MWIVWICETVAYSGGGMSKRSCADLRLQLLLPKKGPKPRARYYYIIILSYYYIIILIYYHIIILSYYHIIILSYYNIITLSYYHIIISSFIILSYYHILIFSYYNIIALSYYYYIINVSYEYIIMSSCNQHITLLYYDISILSL